MHPQLTDTETGIETEIEDDVDVEAEYEPFYRVIIHNDDITPADFVILVLLKFFFLSASQATEVMLAAHTTGLALVQVLPKSEAENRVGKAKFASSLEGYPLQFTIEPE
jgi:ATP-dependent Clp protease adaptor protein ClpS